MTDYNLITKNEATGKWDTIANFKPSDRGGYRVGINATKMLDALTVAKGSEKGWLNCLVVEDTYNKQGPAPSTTTQPLNDDIPFSFLFACAASASMLMTEYPIGISSLI